MTILSEHLRRKPGAEGIPLLLSDGHEWLLAQVTFKARAGVLTTPNIDTTLDRIFESLMLKQAVPLEEVMTAAAALLSANYQATDEELSDLLETEPGEECNRLMNAVLDALFGPEVECRTYTDWIRASLAANGLGAEPIHAHELPHVLGVLAATNRTVPLRGFAEACIDALEKERLEALV